MKFDSNNKFDLCYYGQANTFGGNIYYEAMVHEPICIALV